MDTPTCGDAIHKLGAEDDAGILEHALFERHNQKLRLREVLLDHAPNVLRVAQIQSRIHLRGARRWG